MEISNSKTGEGDIYYKMGSNFKKETFLKLTAILYVIAVLNFTANYFHLYFILWWFDILMHFLGGFWLGGMALWLYFWNNRVNVKFSALSQSRKIFFYFAAVMAVSLVWELFEFSLDTFIVSRANDIMDTLTDLFMDFLGAAGIIFYVSYGKYGSLKNKLNNEQA